MKLGLLTSGTAPLAFVALVTGCQHPQTSAAPPVGTSTSLTSAPIDEHVWRFDFVLTPKDANDSTLTPTAFTMNVQEHRSGEIMIGRNVPLHTFTPDKAVGAISSSTRQDVGLKMKTHVDPVTKGEGIILDVELELSSVETGSPASSIRKVVAHVNVATLPGKPVTVVSLDDDKRHYDLAVTSTKLR